ncbi:MAG TPA: purine-nucleoside phosphorylase [Trueperaceae bacterium]|nr:purine-nucleoside phosphorylase [Trueperaceae bacterium]
MTETGSSAAQRQAQTATQLAAAVAAVRSVTDIVPELAIILGSGLGPLADEIAGATSVPYAAVPGMPLATAPGHAGRFVLGELGGRKVVAMQGRIHPYEGFSAQECTFPVAVMHGLGAGSLVVTNACGGLNPAFSAGDLMLQLDYINFTGQNPLIGPNDDDSYPRFTVMFDCYDPEYLRHAREVAMREGVLLKEGVYLAISGPTYASRAELRAFRTMGADALGMSPVFEVMRARHLGMRVLGISTVTDMALPDRDEHATGDEVLAVAARSGTTFRRFVRAVLPGL